VPTWWAGNKHETGGSMEKKTEDMIQGTLDMLVLKVLAVEPMHGWGITKRIQQASQGTLEVNQGSLYTGLLRMSRAGWIKSGWQVTENNRRAKYYRLTRAGERQLERERERWARMTSAVDQILSLA
jgi:PadR family transcriptional regulator PadR